MQKSSDLTPNDWHDIGNRIKIRRQELRIKQTELAEQVNISINHMSAIERLMISQNKTVSIIQKIIPIIDNELTDNGKY